MRRNLLAVLVSVACAGCFSSSPPSPTGSATANWESHSDVFVAHWDSLADESWETNLTLIVPVDAAVTASAMEASVAFNFTTSTTYPSQPSGMMPCYFVILVNGAKFADMYATEYVPESAPKERPTTTRWVSSLPDVDKRMTALNYMDRGHDNVVVAHAKCHTQKSRGGNGFISIVFGPLLVEKGVYTTTSANP